MNSLKVRHQCIKFSEYRVLSKADNWPYFHHNTYAIKTNANRNGTEIATKFHCTEQRVLESLSASPPIYRRDQLDWPEEKQLHSLDLDSVAQPFN